MTGNTKAIFIRHAESTGNKNRVVKGSAEYPLDDKGRAESVRIASEVARFKPTVVISSPLDRAKHPAQLIADKVGVKLRIDKGFLPPDMGKLTGEAQDTGEKKVAKAFKSPNKAIGGSGDTPAGWDAKNTAAVRRVNVMITRGERPAIITHSRNLRELPHALNGGPMADPTKGGPKPAGFVILKGNNKLVTHKGAA